MKILPMSLETKRAVNRALRAEADLESAMEVIGRCHRIIDDSMLISRRSISRRGLVDRVASVINLRETQRVQHALSDMSLGSLEIMERCHVRAKVPVPAELQEAIQRKRGR